MSSFELNTPVALLTFNRPDTTRRVFERIARAKPRVLLVVSDGPRNANPRDLATVLTTREIMRDVNWDCDLRTNFAETNMGCRLRVSSGIDWVFQQVEEAIILEDDCVPDDTFFQFCQAMLCRYKRDLRVGMITGRNFQPECCRGNDSYYFSKYVHVWGWASWRDRWVGSYDVTMKHWPKVRDEGWLADIVGNESEASYWLKIFDSVFLDRIKTWDYQWLFANWLEGRRNIVPSVNLVSNIGFGLDATHTTGGYDPVPVGTMSFPLRHPFGVFENRSLDKQFYDRFLYEPYYRRALKKLCRIAGF